MKTRLDIFDIFEDYRKYPGVAVFRAVSIRSSAIRELVSRAVSSSGRRAINSNARSLINTAVAGNRRGIANFNDLQPWLTQFPVSGTRPKDGDAALMPRRLFATNRPDQYGTITLF